MGQRTGRIQTPLSSMSRQQCGPKKQNTHPAHVATAQPTWLQPSPRGFHVSYIQTVRMSGYPHLHFAVPSVQSPANRPANLQLSLLNHEYNPPPNPPTSTTPNLPQLLRCLHGLCAAAAQAGPGGGAGQDIRHGELGAAADGPGQVGWVGLVGFRLGWSGWLVRVVGWSVGGVAGGLRASVSKGLV